MTMEAIKVLRGCGATGGKSLAAGTVYAVPGEVSDADAGLLIRLGKAEAVETPAAPERRKTKEAKRDVL